MTRFPKFLIAMLLVVAACGGGDDAADGTTAAPAGNGGSDTTAATTSAAPTTTAAPVANPSDDFCEFIIAYADETDFSPIGMSAAQVEELFTDNVDAINQAAQMAPNEIRGDVVMFAEAYGGFVELLAENGFNFLALGEDVLNDPRLAALEDPELEAAGDRIEAYCGIENFIATAPQPADPGGGGGGGGGVIPGGEIPDDFPAELIPDGAQVLAVTNIAGLTTVIYDIAQPVAEVIDFYTDQLGPAVSLLTDPPGALWVSTDADGLIQVGVSETDPGMTNVSVSVSS